MKKFIFFLLAITGLAVFAAAQTTGTDPFRQEGIASWYGSEFDGKPTASGEIFNSGFFTAAHPTMPYGTLLIVTNKLNGRQVTVRVNDRGPFVASRIIDLSRAAAEVLDMLATGTAPVTVERAAANMALGPVDGAVSSQAAQGSTAPLIAAEVPSPAPQTTPVPQPAPVQQQAPTPQPTQAAPVAQPAPVAQAAPVFAEVQQAPPVAATAPVPQAAAPQAVPAPAPQPQAYQQTAPAVQPAPTLYAAPPARIMGGIPPVGSSKSYRIQVGAYKVPRNAVDAFDKLKNAGLNPAYEKSGDFYRVVLSGLKANEIQPIAQTLGNIGFNEALIREE